MLPKCLAPAEYPAAYSSFLVTSFPADAPLHNLRYTDVQTISNALGWRLHQAYAWDASCIDSRTDKDSENRALKLTVHSGTQL